MGQWSSSWMEALSGLPMKEDAIEGLMRQGRATARSGRVQSFKTAPGRITAKVQGGRPIPFLASVEVPVLNNQEWDTVIDVLADNMRLCARLMAGQEPDELLDLLEERGIHLVPSIETVSFVADQSDFETVPVAGVAVWAAMGEKLRHDPFPLLNVRGRGRERLLKEISAARGLDAGQAGVSVNDLTAVGWTRERRPLQNIDIPLLAPPVISAPSVAPLGNPAGWAGPLSALELFGPAIEKASLEAARLLEPELED